MTDVGPYRLLDQFSESRWLHDKSKVQYLAFIV